MKVLVYGTLKKDKSNHRILSSGAAQFVKEAVVDGYALYYSGFPAAKAEEGAALRGEIWDIGSPEDDVNARSTLNRLDSLESVPYLYTRELVTTRDGEEVSMYVGVERAFAHAFREGNYCHRDGNEHYWDGTEKGAY